MPTPEQHAKLSASSAHRWINCPPSVKLAEQFPSKTSAYAEAGRVAHSIAELKARKCFLEPMSMRTYNAHLKKLQESSYSAFLFHLHESFHPSFHISYYMGD